MKEEVSHHGRVVIAKAYADWVTRSPELKGASQFINDPPALYAAGIEPVYVPTRLPLGSSPSLTARTTRVKNSVDVKMTADCIECAHSYPNIGTYVLVSGDSDFIHVINSLRAIGKRAIIIGVSWSTSRRLADQVDGLILYDSDVDPETHPEPAPAPAVSAPAASRPGAAGGRQQQAQQLSEVMRVIEDIVRAERQAGRTPLLTSLKQRIMRRVPGFDEKKLGFSGFKKLMLRTAQEGNIKLVTVGLVDWVIMADEPIPQEALPDSRVSSSSIESVAAEEEVMPTEAAEATEATETMESTGEVESEPAAPDGDSGADEAGPEPAEAAQPEPEPYTPQPLAPELERALEETLAQLELPDGPGDGQDGRRIVDLIIMADTLEHREGVSHVAFNFLIGEVCGALREGLEAEHPEIAHRWGNQVFSRNYVTRLIRGLRSGGVFIQGWHTDRNEETGRNRRRRTFNLDRDQVLVKAIIESQWGGGGDGGGDAGVAVATVDGDDMPEVSAESPEPVVDAAANGLEAVGESSESEDGVVEADAEADAEAEDAPDAAAKEEEPVSVINRVTRLFRG